MNTTQTKHTPLHAGQRGWYIMPAIPPWCKEVRLRVEVVGPSEFQGDYIRLLESDNDNFLIETPIANFIPD